jgi:hypothetical protein
MTKTLPPNQAPILSAAAHHQALLACAPTGLPRAACNAVFRSILSATLLEEVLAPSEHREPWTTMPGSQA